MPVGCTDRSDALRGCRVVGRVRLVTTNGSPQARRYCWLKRRMKSSTAGRAYAKETACNSKSLVGRIGTSQPCDAK